VALGFGLIYSTTRFFHFAHGAVYTWGAYFTYLFAVWLGLPLSVSILLSMLFTSILGIFIEVAIYRPLKRRKATGLVLLLASLGIFVVLQNIISLLFGDDTKTLRSGIVQEGLDVFGARITPIQVTTISVSCLLFILSSFVLKYTKIGKTVRAVANDPELAQIAGIESQQVVVFTFAVGSALAAVAATLVSLDIDLTPMMGFNALLMGVVAVIIGGVGSFPGAALGGLFLGLSQHLGVWRIGSQWQDAIAFLILLGFLFLRPSGFWGKKIRKV
jgi:branched-chain amino acid transport system permease protein